MAFDLIGHKHMRYTVVTLSFTTDRPGQTGPTQILEEQSDQGLYCLHLLDALHYSKAILLNF